MWIVVAFKALHKTKANSLALAGNSHVMTHHHLAKAFSAELAPRKIRVNIVSPGPIDTPIMTRGGVTTAEYLQTKTFMEGKTVIGRLGVSEEIAEAFLYVASDASKFMLGSELLIDGGMRIK